MVVCQDRLRTNTDEESWTKSAFAGRRSLQRRAA
eukprot:COSAG06_NODE_72046_length_176_cov_14.623377_1_plen_33_part_10